MWTICACGEFLLVPTRCFAAAQGGSWLRQTLTHHPSEGLRRESFRFLVETIETPAVMAIWFLAGNPGFPAATPC
jgi:hypothetical protein